MGFVSSWVMVGAAVAMALDLFGCLCCPLTSVGEGSILQEAGAFLHSGVYASSV